MTVHTTRDELLRALDALWLAVGELALTVHEDGPGKHILVDQLVEQVTELQAAVAQARDDARTSAADPAVLARVDAALDDAWTRYWLRLRDFGGVADLRTACRERGPVWTAWRRSVESGAAQCEQPFLEARARMRGWWLEALTAHTVPEERTETVIPSAGPGTPGPTEPCTARRPS